MPRLDTFQLKLTTGNEGPGGVPKYTINGFPLEFDESSGGTAPGETLDAVAHPQSFPHTLVLSGPEQGNWEILGGEIRYQCDGEEAYTISLGAITLDDRADLNLWYVRPPRVFDV
jgi:hypothetical protein